MHDTYWNNKLVFFYLQEAAGIHRRLPEVSVQGFGSLWPPVLQDDWRRYYDLLHGKNTLGSPFPSEVTYHERVMEWLRWLKRPQQQLTWCRANSVPWHLLVEELGKSKPTLWRELTSSLNQLAHHLNHSDPTGDDHLALRTRALYGD